MPNIRIPNASGHIEITKQDATIITLSTADKYVPTDIEVAVRPHEGSFNNAPTAGVTYTPNTAAATVIPAEGSLYINKGWFEDTVISLAHLIPDDTGLENAGSGHILQGFEAYDTDGKKLVGTIPTITPEFDGGDVSATATASITTAPTATINPDGSFIKMTAPTDGSNLYGKYYGVTQSTTGMEEGTYLTVDGTISSDDGLASASASATRTAVLYDGATTGYVNQADDTVALAAPSSAATDSDTEGIVVTLTDNFSPYYMPIVEVSATGGAVTQGTGTGSVTGTAPALNVTQTGSFVSNASSYGISTTQPSSGTDGTDYLTMDTAASSSQTAQTWSGTATIPWSKTAVTQNGNIAGAIHLDNGSQLRPSDSGSFTADISGSVTATLGSHTPYYIKIVKPQGKGGVVTRTGGNGEVDLVATPTVNQTGSFVDEGSSYGISTIAPEDHGTHDGSTHLTLTTGATADAVVANGETATINYSRAAILSNDTYQGAVNIAEDSQLLGSTTGTLTEDISTGTVTQGTPVGTSEYYIKIVTPTLSGGALTADTTPITMTSNAGSFAVTPNVALKGQADGQWTQQITNSDYNVVGEGDAALSEQNTRWVKIDAGATAAGNVTVSGSITVTRGAVNISTQAGLTNQSLCNGSAMTAASQTYSGTSTVSLGNSIVSEGNDLYVKEVTDLITNTATATITAQPNVNGTATAVYHTSASDTTGTALTLPATNTTTPYVEFDVTQSLTNAANAKANANATATQTKGLTRGNTAEATESSVNIVPTYTTTKVRMNAYDGGYTVS